MALVEEKFRGGKAGELGTGAGGGLEAAQVAGAVWAFRAREGDVGMEGAGFGLESAGGGGGHDELLKGDERRSEIDFSVEDAGAVKDAEFGQVDGDGWGAELGEVDDEAVVLLRRGVAEELQRDVPGLRRGPAELGGPVAEPVCEPGQLGQDRAGQWKGKEEAHVGLV